MKPFLSIVKCTTNQFSNEFLAVGLIMVTKKGVYFDYSKEKIKLVPQLLVRETNSIEVFITNILEKIKEEVIQANQEIVSADTTKAQSIFTIDYFDYLSKYNNNLIQFTKPSTILESFIEKDFQRYFDNFIIGKSQSIEMLNEL